MGLERGNKSDGESDCSEDTPCGSYTPQEEAEMFERERRLKFLGKLTIGDENSLDDLREDIMIRCQCEPSTSIVCLCSSRELGYTRAPIISEQRKASIRNMFLSNRRKNVQKVMSKAFCCQYLDNGNGLVVASQDEKIRFYERSLSRSHPLRFVQSMEICVNSCSWSILDLSINEMEDVLCYSTWKNSLFVTPINSSQNGQNASWNEIELGDCDHSVAIFSLTLSADGRQAVCGSSTYCLNVVDIETKKIVHKIYGAHEDDVNTVCYSDDRSNVIYSSGDDGLIKVWDKRAWQDGEYASVGVFAGHRDGVTFVDTRKDDRYLLSNGKDQTVKVWDLRKFSSLNAIEGTRSSVQKQTWDYRFQPAPTGLNKPVQGDTSVMTFKGHSVLHTLVRAKFSPESTGKRFIYTGCARGEVVVYDMLTGEVANRLKGFHAVVRDVDWNPSENEIAACSWDGVTSVFQWDERASRVTRPEPNARFGDDDSCDEWYAPIEVKRPRQKKKRQSKRLYKY